jgi:alkanesulfonate monooxygenase SsuD/methylene tetrahydromethanopterin reductase-like flavin-dependent oxidoreductase (luciferase family)
MRFGIVLLTDQPWSEAAPRWRAAEEMGFDHAWTYDHLVWGGLPDSPWHGALPTLAAAAGVTRTIGLGTLVSAPNLHHPYRLFRDAQAVEDISGGRFRLAVGTGGDRDSGVLGAEPLGVRDRVERFFEFVDLLDRLRHEDQVTYQGRWFTTDDARTLPGATFPLIVAGNGPRAVRHAARRGDAWVTTGPGTAETLDDWFAGLARSAGVFGAELSAVGRADVPRLVHVDSTPHIDAGEARYALRSAGFFAEMAGRLDELGFTDMVVAWPRPEDPYAGSESILERVAAEVIPGLR